MNRGDLIAEIDARDYQARAEEARAHLADMSARADGAQSNLLLTSTVTNAVLTQAGAAAGAAGEQVKMLQARVSGGCRCDSRGRGGHGTSRSAAIRRPGGSRAVPPRMPSATGRCTRKTRSPSSSWTGRKRRPGPPQRRRRQPARQPKPPRRIWRRPGRRRYPPQAGLRQAEQQVVQAQGRVSEAKSAPQQIEVRHADVSSLRAQVDQQTRRRRSRRNWRFPTRGSTRPNPGTSRASRWSRATSCRPASRCWRWCRIGSGWSPISRKLN